MGMLRFHNLSWRGQERVEQALDLLRLHATGYYSHLHRVIEGVKYLGGGGCGENAIACTAGPHERWIVLTSPPEATDPLELAVTLSHEARHWAIDHRGNLYTVEHTCRDCSLIDQRARDAIYQEDERLRSLLWQAMSPRPPVQMQSMPVMQLAPPVYSMPAPWVPVAPQAAPAPDLAPLLAFALARRSPAPEAFALGLLAGLGLAALRNRR